VLWFVTGPKALLPARPKGGAGLASSSDMHTIRCPDSMWRCVSEACIAVMLWMGPCPPAQKAGRCCCRVLALLLLLLLLRRALPCQPSQMALRFPSALCPSGPLWLLSELLLCRPPLLWLLLAASAGPLALAVLRAVEACLPRRLQPSPALRPPWPQRPRLQGLHAAAQPPPPS